MKTRFFSFLLALIITAGTTLFAADGGKEKQVKIKTSAKCEMCKERIEKNLTFTKGVKEAFLNLDDKSVTVTYNPKKTDVDKIKAAISKTGYDADEVIADQASHDKLPDCCQKSATAHSDKGHGNH